LAQLRRLGFCNSSDFSSLGVGVGDFADYFANVPVPLVHIPTSTEHLGGFSFRLIDLVECFSTYKSITYNALGVDGISVKFFELLLPLICCHVLHVFNHAITSSAFPSMWKVAIIRPVAKVGTPSDPSDFRPISIVSVLSKGVERILHDQVLAHVNGCNLLSDFQSGFRCGQSTVTALVRITEDLRSRYMLS
jgi:hypothetical protein